MTSKRTLCISLIMSLAVATLSCAQAGLASEDDKKAVVSAAAQFYAALNTMFTGNANPMKEVWSHADDVTYMGPGGGFQVGWGQVRQVGRRRLP